jgi:hypothetical protein
VLSSSNAAGSGILVKSYPYTRAPSATGRLTWDDALVTHATILRRFPGQPNDPALFACGLSAPFIAEFSGVLVFGMPGEYKIVLQCAGACQLFIYGVPPVDTGLRSSVMHDCAA